MRKILLTTGALVALVVSPALAQDATQPPIEPMPAPEVLPEPAPLPEAGPDILAEETIATPKFLAQQETTELLATHLIGSTVYSPTDETLGDINDLVFNEDNGTIKAVIVGVGGFLGLGQKNVAVSFDAITETTDADGNMRLVLDTNVAELEAAPAFVTLADLQRQQEMDQMEQMQPVDPTAPPAIQ